MTTIMLARLCFLVLETKTEVVHIPLSNVCFMFRESEKLQRVSEVGRGGLNIFLKTVHLFRSLNYRSVCSCIKHADDFREQTKH